MSNEATAIFCYGTLLKGNCNHSHYCADALTIEPAVTTGKLYHLPMGFPVLIESDEGQVLGELMTFPDLQVALRRIDRLEGYDVRQPASSMYIRKVRSVTLLASGMTVPAYCYVWQAPLPTGSVDIPGGYWQADRP